VAFSMRALPHLVAVVVLLSTPTDSAFSNPALLRPRDPTARTLLRRRAHELVPTVPNQRPGSVIMMASVPRAAVSPSAPRAVAFVRAIARAALMLATSLLATMLCVGKAFAVTAARSKVPPTLAEMLLTGTTLKYGSVALVLGAMYAFRKEETPLLQETVDTTGRPVARVDLDAREPPKDEVLSSMGAPPAAAAIDADSADKLPSALPLDDSSMFGSLQARMQQLAAESAAAEKEEPEESPQDSTDTWGTGNQAVLEPPRKDEGGLLDGLPPVDFPVGFPLVDGQVTENKRVGDNKPAASDSDVEMLKRMFGGA